MHMHPCILHVRRPAVKAGQNSNHKCVTDRISESIILQALTQVLKVLLRVEVSSAFGVLKVELSSGSSLR